MARPEILSVLTENEKQDAEQAKIENEYKFDQNRIDKMKQEQNFEITDEDAREMEEMIKKKREKKKNNKS
jgi:hypothetical protein